MGERVGMEGGGGSGTQIRFKKRLSSCFFFCERVCACVCACVHASVLVCADGALVLAVLPFESIMLSDIKKGIAGLSVPCMKRLAERQVHSWDAAAFPPESVRLTPGANSGLPFPLSSPLFSSHGRGAIHRL